MQVCVYTYLYVRMIKGGLLCGRSIQEQGPHNSSDSRKCVLLVSERCISGEAGKGNCISVGRIYIRLVDGHCSSRNRSNIH